MYYGGGGMVVKLDIYCSKRKGTKRERYYTRRKCSEETQVLE